MKELMRLKEVTAKVGERELFKIDHLSLRDNQIIGLIGRNGSGKSTLLSMLAGENNDYQGALVVHIEPTQICFVPQEVVDYQQKNEENYQQDYLKKQWQDQSGFEKLSGGEKLKKRLKAALNSQAQLLILDEPTNHLDQKSVDELIAALKRYQGTLIVVSHDRYFLDQITTDIWSIEDQKLQEYPGNYTKFVEQRELDRQTQQKLYTKQQKEIKKVKKEMKQLTDWSDSAHAQSTKQEFQKEFYRSKAKKMDTRRKSIQKRLENQLVKDGVERLSEEYQIRFQLDTSQLKKGPLYLVENLAKNFGQQVIFQPSDFTVMFGDRMAITGDNGAGKTTLLKILLGLETYSGELWQSEFAKIGYLSQEVFDLPLSTVVGDFFSLNRIEETQGMTLFIHLGFQANQWQQEIGNLSMGERVKLKLMKHILDAKNVLILDEPTNHLDIPAREELEKVLGSYQGTLIFVSHDRYFREKVATETLEITHQKIKNVTKQASQNESPDRFLLEFQKTELLAKLSTVPVGSSDYQKLSADFESVLQKLKNSEG